MVNIWTKLEKPIFCLAPMLDVTDSAFRQLLCEIGRPDLMFTEFVNVHEIDNRNIRQINALKFAAKEKPLICQIWGSEPDLFKLAVKKLTPIGFAGIDLNFGCPDKAVVKKGCGAAMIDNPDLAGKIISATLKAARGRLPVSVKTRLGYKTINTEPWLKFLLNFDLAAISVHCRTAKAMSTGPLYWEEVKKIVRLRNKLNPRTLIIGNGDIFSRETAFQRIKETGVDGIMIGRGVFHDPYIFNPHDSIKTKTKAEKINLLIKHIDLYQKTWGKTKPVHPLKRFFKIYLNGFRGALKLRAELMEGDSFPKLLKLLK